MASTRVVLPWSTWATIATLRRSERRGMRRARFILGRGPEAGPSLILRRKAVPGRLPRVASLEAQQPGATLLHLKTRLRAVFEHIRRDAAQGVVAQPARSGLGDQRRVVSLRGREPEHD